MRALLVTLGVWCLAGSVLAQDAPPLLVITERVPDTVRIGFLGETAIQRASNLVLYIGFDRIVTEGGSCDTASPPFCLRTLPPRFIAVVNDGPFPKVVDYSLEHPTLGEGPRASFAEGLPAPPPDPPQEPVLQPCPYVTPTGISQPKDIGAIVQGENSYDLVKLVDVQRLVDRTEQLVLWGFAVDAIGLDTARKRVALKATCEGVRP